MPNTKQLIVQGAKARGLDPRALLAVASVEGGFGGAIGDQGTSYGPYQLHVGGALPRGRGNRWANSPQGINYALDHIAQVARGKRGLEAIRAIVTQFERPANPGAEVQKAFGRYGQVGGGDAGQPRPSPLPGLATAPAPQQEIGQALLAAVQAGPQHNDFSQLYQLIQQHAQTRAQDEAQHIASAIHPATPTPLGKVTLAPGADARGVHTSAAVLQFVRQIAGLARTTLTIGTGSNHSHMTVNGNVSDHWSGHAADIAATGANLIHLGRLALIAAGANPKWAMKQTGGLFNVGGHQVIFNTHKGGDHTNHLHVSAH